MLVDPLLVFALVLQAQVEVTARATCSDGDEGWGRVLASNDRGRESHREEHLTTDRTDRESSSMVAGGTENSVAALVLCQKVPPMSTWPTSTMTRGDFPVICKYDKNGGIIGLKTQ